MNMPTLTTRADAERVAANWIAQWNSRDVEAVLAKFADDVVFRSPKAVDLAGSPVLVGKQALRSYWLTAVERISEIQFELDHVGFDADRQELFIVYIASLAGRRSRACERLRFGPHGVVDGEALYGAPL